MEFRLFSLPVVMCVLGVVLSCYWTQHTHYNRHSATSIKLNLVTEVKTNIVSP